MSDFIDVAVFAQLVKNAGLDFANDADVKRFEDACDEYKGDNPKRDIMQILGNAVARKPGSEILARLNELSPLGQSTPNPQPSQSNENNRNRDGFSILDALNQENPL